MKDFLGNEDTSDFSHTRMNIYFRELGNERPLLVKLIMQSIYKNNDRKAVSYTHLDVYKRQAQYEALKAVNKEMIALYWEVGKRITEQQTALGWRCV